MILYVQANQIEIVNLKYILTGRQATYRESASLRWYFKNIDSFKGSS